MNVQLKDITVTARDGRVSHLDQVYIRGSHVRFFIVPDMLRYVYNLSLLRGEEIFHMVWRRLAYFSGLVGMRRCSGPGDRGGEVSGWLEEGLPLIGLGGRGEGRRRMLHSVSVE